MKYLSHYVQEAQDKLFNETGAFFAFSKDQFDKQKKEGVQYTALSAGMLCPVEHAEKLTTGLVNIAASGREQDMAENGKDRIIERELHNYECFYTNDISEAFIALMEYGITIDEVRAVYNRVAPTVDY